MDLRLCLFLLATTVAKPQQNISPDCSLETDGFCDDGQEQSVESVELDQTIPKILLVGPTGSGKSSMANSLLGIDPETEDAMFPVCMDMDSCTKETTYAEGKWLGYGERFIVVDTPGLQDSDGQDNQLIREMIDVLKNKVKTVDCIVLLIEGTTERFHAGLTTQLRQLSTIFGERWWNFLLIGVSKWKYDKISIKQREHQCKPGKKSCKDEKWFKRNILHQLEKKFHQTRPFQFAFVHSYSQIEWNKDDESEQKHWKEETDQLWSFVTSKNSSFELKGVDDILQDNRRLKRQVDELENTIDTEIADLKGEIQMIKETHDSELNQLKNKTLGQINTNMGMLDTKMKQLKKDTKTEILNLSLTPVGTVIGWLGGKYMDVPSGWQRCDGTKIFSGSMKDDHTPNLNVGGYFLRGAQTVNAWTIQEDMIRQHGHSIHDPEHTHTDKGHLHGFDDTYYDDITQDLDSGDDSIGADNDLRDRSDVTDIGTADLTNNPTGIKVNDITGATAGAETRPRNIAVEWIIKIE